MESFLPALKQSVASPKWRVRASAYDAHFRVAASSRNLSQVVSLLDPLMLQGLSDRIFEVRSHSAAHVGLVAAVFR